MAMKPVAKKALIVIAVLYLVTVVVMIVVAYTKPLSTREKAIVDDIKKRVDGLQQGKAGPAGKTFVASLGKIDRAGLSKEDGKTVGEIEALLTKLSPSEPAENVVGNVRKAVSAAEDAALSESERRVISEVKLKLDALRKTDKDLIEVDESGAERIYETELKRRGEIIAFNYTMVLNILNFGVLFFLMYGFLWDPMLKFLDERSRQVAENVDSAEQDRAQAATERDEANRERARARDEHAQVRSRARHEALSEREEIVAKAHEEAHRLIQHAQEELQVAIETAKAELRAQIGDLACEVAARILEREIRPQDQDALVEEFMANLEKAEIG